MPDSEQLIVPHGGYRRLKSFQIARLVYDVTARFCELYVDRHSRTRDQMVQAARSGLQNIAEGSHASGTSKKPELRLTGVARASLEELRLDYEDWLRQRGAPAWPPSQPALQRFRAMRCDSLDALRAWVEDEHRREPDLTPGMLVANAALSLLNLACYLLDRQIAAQAAAFEHEGGFTERLYRVRAASRLRATARKP